MARRTAAAGGQADIGMYIACLETDMDHYRQLQLARSRWGRIRLHTATMLRDRLWGWHLQGILREFPGGRRRRGRSGHRARGAAA